MNPAELLTLFFIFAFGCCIGSFLNVVIYRLPREKSLVTPPSACPSCGEHIRFYDNIPLVSWIALGAKCRNCKAKISPRYFIVELLTGSTFVGLYYIYFHTEIFPSIQVPGAWFIYGLHIILLAGFIAGSGIDLEYWVIPLSICWLVTGAGFLGSAIGGFFVNPAILKENLLLPVAKPGTGAMAVGAMIGLGISLLLIYTGILKRSYEIEGQIPQGKEPRFNHRKESLLEILFLLPIILLGVGAWMLVTKVSAVGQLWEKIIVYRFVAGLLGSVWGYLIGCAVVWTARLLGTLALGKEAMGLGDVHLMGAAGAVVGPVYVFLAFFIAPFFGLSWACFQMFFKKIRQIPYGPFLSLGVLSVMIGHDWIYERISDLFFK